jgi:hypothetical protein
MGRFTHLTGHILTKKTETLRSVKQSMTSQWRCLCLRPSDTPIHPPSNAVHPNRNIYL